MSIAPQPTPAGASIAPPAARQVPQAFTLHGDTRDDPYAWLRDKSDPDVLAHLEAENAYAAAVMAPTRSLQEALYTEMVGRIKQTDTSVPYRRGVHWYYTRTYEGRQYPVLCRHHADDPTGEEVLLDLNVLCADGPFISLGHSVVSDDGRFLAYTLDTSGYRQYKLDVKDLQTGELVGPSIARVDDVVWAADMHTLVYVTQDEVTKRTDRAWFHRLGSSDHQAIFEELDESYDLSLRRTRDGSTIVLSSVAKDTSECRYFPAHTPQASPAVFAPRRDGVQYALDVANGRFFIHTNEGAPDFAVFATALDAPQRDAWTVVVPERTGTTITALETFADFAAVLGRREGRASIELLTYATGELMPIAFEGDDYVVDLADNAEFVTPDLRFTYESLTTPPSTIDFTVAMRTRALLKTVDVPGYDPGAYRSERRFVAARDGTLIPVSLVHKPMTAAGGPRPLLLYGYGSYGIPIDPHFSAARISLLDRGVIFAIAHIRGGGEYGEAWRLAGNLMNKRTSFTDFIDVADALVADGTTARDRLAIEGASAGGLLVGAAINLRPDLCAAAVAKVPFVDVLTTMLDASLPLTTGEYREWGNPADPEAYAYMRSYSPIDNIVRAAYPAVLVEAGYNDSQVPYWEGAKFAAKLRTHTTSGKLVLLKTNLSAGHGGSSGRYERLREIAFTYAFVLSQIAGAGPSGAGPARRGPASISG